MFLVTGLGAGGGGAAPGDEEGVWQPVDTRVTTKPAESKRRRGLGAELIMRRIQQGLGEKATRFRIWLLRRGRSGLICPAILPGPMECGRTNPARAGRQQRQFAPHPPWLPWLIHYHGHPISG